jgi:AraC-like DNA-binding protein
VLLRELGQDPAEVFREAGVDIGLLEDPENCIGFRALGRLLARCALRCSCDHFGLLVGEHRGLDALGLVGMLVQHSPNVGGALRNLVLHLHLHDRGAVPIATVEGDRALFGYAVYQPGIEGTSQIHDAAMAIGHNILKSLCGPAWEPTEVVFSHSRPANLEPYRRIFRAPLRFDSERSALVFSATWLEQPITHADPELRRLLEERIAELESMGPGDVVDQVRRVLRNLMLGGRGSLEQVASVFAVHRRTLNRRMRAHGLTFKELVEEVRYDIARQLLAETHLAVVEVAAVLEYADAASFTRAFRRWSGTTPAAWRAGRRAS